MTEEEQKKTNWSWSVAGIAIRDGKVLLARHTYGSGDGKLIIPGGYCLMGESPQDAVKREFQEETGIEVCPENLVGLRFSPKDWYAVFSVRYISGEARSDHDENNEVVWIETIPYQSKHENHSLYACKPVRLP